MNAPATAKRRIVVIVNAESGADHDEALPERLQRLFEGAGAVVRIAMARGGTEIAAAIEAAVAERPDIVVAGGGDGTVSGVAAALVDSRIALGVLPLGTLNHFAKDLGVPLELEQAVQSIVRGRPVPVDVGEVNGRIFINNSSLGLYPDIVRDRERQQRRLGRGKWPALLWASLAALRRYSFLSVKLSIDGTERLRRTPFVFIGNNGYRMEGFAIGERERLDAGRLSLYFAQKPGRFRLLLLALRALAGRLKQARDFDALLATEIVIESRHRRLRVATDGEVTSMTPPLHYRVRPLSLQVVRGEAPHEPGS
ncbi:MAG: sphingosine kinase [Pseudomonadota bacterium]|nr:sphingosine kinase [Pseudomonadota bacterium]